MCLSECSVSHVLVSCPANKRIKDRLLPTLLNIVADVQPKCELLQSYQGDPRLLAHNPLIGNVFEMSRDWCYAVFNERSRQCKDLCQT